MLTKEIYLAILFSLMFHVVTLVYTDNSISKVGDNIDNVIELQLVSKVQPSLSKNESIAKKVKSTKQISKKFAVVEPAFEQLKDIEVSREPIIDQSDSVENEDNKQEQEQEQTTNNASPSVATVRKNQDKGYTIPKPKYPNLARKQGYEGVVKYRVVLDDQLKIKNIILISSSGYNILDREAERSIQRGKFTAKVDEVYIIIRFRLDDVF